MGIGFFFIFCYVKINSSNNFCLCTFLNEFFEFVRDRTRRRKILFRFDKITFSVNINYQLDYEDCLKTKNNIFFKFKFRKIIQSQIRRLLVMIYFIIFDNNLLLLILILHNHHRKYYILMRRPLQSNNRL